MNGGEEKSGNWENGKLIETWKKQINNNFIEFQLLKPKYY